MHRHYCLAVLDRAPDDLARVGPGRKADRADRNTLDGGAEDREFALRASTGRTHQEVRCRDAGLVARAGPVLHADRLSIERGVRRLDDISDADHDVGAVRVQGGAAAQPVSDGQAAAEEPLGVGLSSCRQDDDVGVQPLPGVQDELRRPGLRARRGRSGVCLTAAARRSRGATCGDVPRRGPRALATVGSCELSTRVVRCPAAVAMEDDLGADQSTSDDHHPSTCAPARVARRAVLSSTVRRTKTPSTSGLIEKGTRRAGAGGHHQTVEVGPIAIVEGDVSASQVEACGGLPEPPGDIEIARLDLQADPVKLAGEKGLRQWKTVVGPMKLCTEDRQVTGITEAAQALRCLMSGERTSDHEDSFHATCPCPSLARQRSTAHRHRGHGMGCMRLRCRASC